MTYGAISFDETQCQNPIIVRGAQIAIAMHSHSVAIANYISCVGSHGIAYTNQIAGGFEGSVVSYPYFIEDDGDSIMVRKHFVLAQAGFFKLNKASLEIEPIELNVIERLVKESCDNLKKRWIHNEDYHFIDYSYQKICRTLDEFRERILINNG